MLFAPGRTGVRRPSESPDRGWILCNLYRERSYLWRAPEGRPIQTLPHDEFLAHLRAQTNLLPAAVPDLVIRAFGKPQVRVKGRLVTQQQWQTRSVREMFFMFVHTPGGLTKEQIGELLWPGSEPESLKLRFKNEIYRLRRAVGQDVITYEDVFYRFNRALDFEYDVEAFDAFLVRASRIRDRHDAIAHRDATARTAAAPETAFCTASLGRTRRSTSAREQEVSA